MSRLLSFENTVFYGGPVCALLALALFSAPGLRPRVLMQGILWLAAIAGFPFLLCVLMRSDYGILCFFLRPLTGTFTVAVSVIYLTDCLVRHLPLLTAVPLLPLLCGASIDFYSVWILGGKVGGSDC